MFNNYVRGIIVGIKLVYMICRIHSPSSSSLAVLDELKILIMENVIFLVSMKWMNKMHSQIISVLLANIKNTIIFFVCPSKILHKHCFYFLLRLTMVPRGTGSSAYTKFRTDNERVLWYLQVIYSRRQLVLKSMTFAKLHIRSELCFSCLLKSSQATWLWSARKRNIAQFDKKCSIGLSSICLE